MSANPRKVVSILVLVAPLLLYPSAAALAGTGGFAVTSSPNQGTSNNEFLGVASVSASDAWSVGYYQSATCVCSQRTLGEHWNGTRWSIVSTPNPATKSGDYDVLKGAAAVSSSDAWAVGYTGNASYGQDKSLIEHWKWNGTQWTQVSTQNVGTSNNTFQAVAASSGDVWAVGEWYQPASPYQAQTLAEACAACS